MKYSFTLLVCVFALSSSFVSGQTAKEIEARYGQRENVYSIGEHLWMTPTYGADSRLCLMRLYPKLVSRDTNYPDAKLDLDEVLKFINQRFPVETRGVRNDSFGTSDLGGGVIWTRFNYDQVRFVFISTFRLEKLPLHESVLRGEAIDLEIDKTSLAEFRRKEALKSDDDLMRKHALNPKVLEIYWANRKCIKP
jgi:hypothetical protein